MDNTSNDASLTYVRRSMVKRVTKDPQGAVDDCTHALSINKDNIEANWQRSLAYCAMHKVDNAVPDLQQVIHTNPNFADAHFMLAECYSVLGRAREALPEYQRAANLYAAQHDEDGKKLAMKRIAELSAHS
jgi:tetratricopeptide (TPR) repeat protein